ncbi:MAG: hypothetical protein KKC85_01490 [Gammaproteobacteria bacterium]|nr:hypothetical protein [Gammaproteobacteria bacterium]MBU1443290.1 hypothetical protein [Gammaproteobacteria bacterium]MBU2285091.1 hypothetical protein [Gammaproteobacteria bacterium]
MQNKTLAIASALASAMLLSRGRTAQQDDGSQVHSPGHGAALRTGRFLATTALSCLALLGLTSCTSFIEDVRDYQAGWRTAEVMEVGFATEIASSGLTDCRATASTKQITSSRFAVLAYRASGFRHRHVVIVEDNPSVARGDMVFTNVFRCGTPLELVVPSQNRTDESVPTHTRFT